VPARPGALSAFGILVSDVVKDYSQTVLWRTLDELPLTRLNAEFNKLRRTAHQDFLTEKWKGAIQYRLSVDVRYRGQGYELNIPYTDRLIAAFRREHNRRYGYSYPVREIELVTLRLRAIMKSPQSNLGRAGAARGERGKLDPERTSVFFESKKITSAIFDRESLQPGKKYSGAAIVTEYSATTIVPPRAKFWLDRNGNLFIQLRP
jgi:N-methylhydantoinase A